MRRATISRLDVHRSGGPLEARVHDGPPGVGETIAAASYGVPKRALDICLSLAVLVATAPLLILAGLAIVLLERQNPVFVQERVGQGGRRFRMFKLRSMRPEHTPLLDGRRAGERANIKEPDDPRVTAIGRLLRRTSVDELPQLINVLLGEMSLVGPRPALPEEVTQYPRSWRRALSVRPGLTGLWQVSGRSELTRERRASLDRLYLQRRSLTFDALILLRTVWATVSMRGAW